MQELFKSRAFWAVIIALLSAALGYFGYQLTPEDQDILVISLMGLGAVVAPVAGVVHRTRRSKRKTGIADRQRGNVTAAGLFWLTWLSFVAALLFVPIFAFAADANLSWSTPTERVDGSTLQAADISKFEICIKQGAAFLGDTDCPTTVVVPGTQTSVTVRGAIPDDSGRAAFFRIKALDTDALASEWSNVVEKKAASRPKAPVLK